MAKPTHYNPETIVQVLLDKGYILKDNGKPVTGPLTSYGHYTVSKNGVSVTFYAYSTYVQVAYARWEIQLISTMFSNLSKEVTRVESTNRQDEESKVKKNTITGILEYFGQMSNSVYGSSGTLHFVNVKDCPQTLKQSSMNISYNFNEHTITSNVRYKSVTQEGLEFINKILLEMDDALMVTSL